MRLLAKNLFEGYPILVFGENFVLGWGEKSHLISVPLLPSWAGNRKHSVVNRREGLSLSSPKSIVNVEKNVTLMKGYDVETLFFPLYYVEGEQDRDSTMSAQQTDTCITGLNKGFSHSSCLVTSVMGPKGLWSIIVYSSSIESIC